MIDSFSPAPIKFLFFPTHATLWLCQLQLCNFVRDTAAIPAHFVRVAFLSSYCVILWVTHFLPQLLCMWLFLSSPIKLDNKQHRMSGRPRARGRHSHAMRMQPASVSTSQTDGHGHGPDPSFAGRACLSLFSGTGGHAVQAQHTEEVVEWLTKPS